MTVAYQLPPPSPPPPPSEMSAFACSRRRSVQIVLPCGDGSHCHGYPGNVKVISPFCSCVCIITVWEMWRHDPPSLHAAIVKILFTIPLPLLTWYFDAELWLHGKPCDLVVRRTRYKKCFKQATVSSLSSLVCG